MHLAVQRQYILCNSSIVHWVVIFSSTIQTTSVLKTSSLLCVLHWSVSPADFVHFFFSTFQGHWALCDVSTVSFPLQSKRIRRRSCKDGSLEWTRSRPVEMTDHFGSTSQTPHTSTTHVATDFDDLLSLQESRERKTDCVCTFVGEKQEQNGTKARF